MAPKKKKSKKSEFTVFFDVDGTLIRPAHTVPYAQRIRTVRIRGREFCVHRRHLREIDDANARNHTVVVWSKGGPEWAEDVLRALEIRDLVDHVISKPLVHYDDQDASTFMGERVFHEDC